MKVYLGLSGGVDSAVSAYLLLKQGFDVTGVFMRNWAGSDGKDPDCPQKQDRDAAEQVARYLGIKFEVLDFVDDYMERVMKHFLQGYKQGITPNPDVLCNSQIKFGVFRHAAMQASAEWVATGHYAKLQANPDNPNEQALWTAKDNHKDQTYFLADVKTEQFQNAIFPLGELTKPEVRKIATEIGLPNAQRKDSQGICFVGKINVREYIRQQLGERPGDIVDADTGKVVGQHQGIWLLTIGQRHGLGLGGLDKPYYVCGKDAERNIIYVCAGKDHELLNRSEIAVRKSDLNLIGNDLTLEKLQETQNLTTRIRHRGQLVPVESVEFDGDKVVIKHQKTHWAPAPGQTLVFYNDSRCLGGAVMI